LSRLPAGYVTDRLGRPVPLIVGALLAYALALNLLGQVATLPGLGVMALVMGSAAGTAFVTLGAVVGSSSDPRLRGLAVGVYSTFLYLGLALGPAAVGAVMNVHGYAVGFSLAGVVAGVGGVFVAVMARNGTLHRKQ
jgi:MFS family permease